eukprot:TRINITY_DN485_c0_g1_i3.p1 TRINITY_DN485_c0_g1~~TRINITY_DN485_c0_g1_i3.p1  ORF type:complete len:429 (-),score=98.41 TRINITY_DN485_c0_g1_i3:122-1408(-)
MEFRLPATANTSLSRYAICFKGKGSEKVALYVCSNDQARKTFNILCSASSGSRGFGPEPKKREKSNNVKAPKEDRRVASQKGKTTFRQSDAITRQAPGFASDLDGKSSNVVLDRQFEERLQAVRKSALEQRNMEENKQYQAIDYDAPPESEQSTVGLGTKVGVGVAVVVFGLVFALGDFLPSESVSSNDEATIIGNKLTEEEKTNLQARLQQYEGTLRVSPEDPTALEGAAATLAELGEYSRAVSLLEKVTKERPKDSGAYRLLGEVKYELKDYEGSAASYKSSASVSDAIDLEVLRGLTNAYLAAKKPDEAVQVLLDARERLNTQNPNRRDVQADTSSNLGMEVPVNPIQVELLLGKAYSDWGHISDAVSVYDRLISEHPDDFRGYLAKAIILKENGKVGDAERMFIQARFFAPENAKAFVDRYARR